MYFLRTVWYIVWRDVLRRPLVLVIILLLIGFMFLLFFVTTSFLSLFIASAILAAVVYLSAKQKKREFGALCALGASRIFIFILILIEALIYTIAAIIVGLSAFYFMNWDADKYLLEMILGILNMEFDKQAFVDAISVFSAVLLISSFIPAYIISSKKVIDSIESRQI
jgi:putative ABC transport system permease protein